MVRTPSATFNAYLSLEVPVFAEMYGKPLSQEASRQFVSALREVSNTLIWRGLADRSINLKEAVMMQCVSYLLSKQASFHPIEVAELAGIYPGAAYPTVRKFRDDYELLDDHSAADPAKGRGSKKKLYIPTELGHEVFGEFKPVET